MPDLPDGSVDSDWLESIFGRVDVKLTRYRTHGSGAVTLTQQLCEQAQTLGAEGMHRHRMGPELGIPRATFYYWLQKGREETDALEAWIQGGSKGDQPEVTLVSALLDAVERGESNCCRYIGRRMLSAEQPRDVLAFAERRFPKQFSPKTAGILDDETGETHRESNGASVFEALMGKLAALGSNLGGDDGGAD